MDRMLHSSRTLQLFFTAIIFLLASPASGQIEGCTDPYALNYNSNASWNDGSCIYEETFFIPMQHLELPEALEETSGLIFWADGIWTFNDSGGDPKIYKVDTISGIIIQEITISNGNNVDWEDIAQDEDHIYVGDFGNNSGTRKDLLIYRIAKADIPSTGNADVSAEVISYSYADQEDFTPKPENNEYDCEAMICVEGNIYLFTKNWVSETSRLYSMSSEPGNYSLLPLDTLNTSGLVTGAAFSDELGQVILSGYRNYMPILFLLFDYPEYSFFSGNKRLIQMPGIFGAQTEGVCFAEGYNAFLSCEKSLLNQKLFTFSTATWTDTTMVYLQENHMKLEVEVYPNPVDGGPLTIDIYNPQKDSYHIKIYESSGKLVLNREYKASVGNNKHTLTVSIPEITTGMYLLHIFSEDMYANEMLIIR